MFTVNATYQVTDSFEIDFDLSKVFEFYIKWGVLHVTMNEGDEEIEIHPTFNNTDDPQFKWPTKTVVENEEGDETEYDNQFKKIVK